MHHIETSKSSIHHYIDIEAQFLAEPKMLRVLYESLKINIHNHLRKPGPTDQSCEHSIGVEPHPLGTSLGQPKIFFKVSVK